ncbi:hypothetical protein CDL15_Pgr026922 [Punica granatum]|uniref:Glycosyltransferase n=1 Tax=Punica granatum TaxID=22663 RepID=A0A218XZI3_PUNGR|nr:hypothetical protein CDL15_Pgr026922 [Punica granatum]
MDPSTRKLHALCLPSPAQSHIGAMLKLAKLLHHRGIHITFVNTEFNHSRLLRLAQGGSTYLDRLPPDFQFVVIPDGLPPSESDATQDLKTMCDSVRHRLVAPVCSLIGDLNERAASDPTLPRVSCIVADGFMTFSACPAGEKFGIPVVNLFTISACSLMGFMQLHQLMEKGFIPLKDETYLTSCYLDTTIDWIPGMKSLRLRDLPRFFRSMDPNDILCNFCKDTTARADKADATIIHTFDALESDVLGALSVLLPRPVYAIGPFELLLDRIPEHKNSLKHIACNLWEEDIECLQWLDLQKPKSVLYVNFGSVVFLTPEQLVGFAMGMADSEHPFLWIIRSDLVSGDTAILPPGFIEKTKGRGFICDWCPQEEVLKHPSTGAFLTHCGWNSTIEALTAGVPMLCWPCQGDQPTNCRYSCTEWEVGLEIDSNVKRDGVERLVRELMEGERGKHLTDRAMEWKKLAIGATEPHGSSSVNLDNLFYNVLSR